VGGGNRWAIARGRNTLGVTKISQIK